MYNTKTNGKVLKKLRIDTEESVAEVADAVGVSPSSYFAYENGSRTPRDEVKVKIAQHFGVPVGEIFFAE